MRNTPIITFINKLDRDGLEPLEILADIEDKLQIECAPLSWPIGMGKDFKGVYNLYRKSLHLFTPGKDTGRRRGSLSPISGIPGWTNFWGQANRFGGDRPVRGRPTPSPARNT